MKQLLPAALIAAVLTGCFATAATGAQTEKEKIVCAYMAHSATDSVPTRYINRLIYSHVYLDTTLTDVTVLNPSRLRYASSLKSRDEGLEVMVSFGGSPSTLSRAMRCDSLRAIVVDRCVDIINEFNLDGIDIDWEYPGRGEGALSEKEDVANYVALLADLRRALGPEKIITIACAGSGYGVDLPEMARWVDQFNVMCYDMGTPPSHHSALYPSEHVAWIETDGSISRFLDAGVPPEKIILGMPFYGRGSGPFNSFVEWRDITLPDGATERFDSTAMVPWIADAAGEMILTYDNPRSLAMKCRYAADRGLAGAMYWRIEEDDSAQSLGRAVYTTLNP